jgi:hypothetical protein
MFSGIIGDQVSTRLGVLKMGVYEANPIVNWLLNNNLWLPLDLLLFTLIISLTKLSRHHLDYKFKHCLVLSPFIICIMRIIAMIHNLHLFYTL